MLSPHIHSTIIRDEQSQPQHRVVFLHGLFGRGKNFTTIASALTPEAECLLVDLPNHGESGWSDHFDYIEIADQVAQLLRSDFASESPIQLIGHSMGGKVAMVLALRHPDLVEKLVVLDISPRSTSAAQSGFGHLLSSLRSLDLSSISRRSEASEQLRSAIPSDRVRGFLLQNLVSTESGFAWQPHLSMLDDEIEIVMGFPVLHEAKFEKPVLWIDGALSDYVSDEDEPLMRGYFTNVNRLTIENAGHWVHAEKPNEVISAIRSFLFAGSN